VVSGGARRPAGGGGAALQPLDPVAMGAEIWDPSPAMARFQQRQRTGAAPQASRQRRAGPLRFRLGAGVRSNAL